jgi:hypothetical protein
MGCADCAVDSTNDGSGIFLREGLARILGMPVDFPVGQDVAALFDYRNR